MQDYRSGWRSGGGFVVGDSSTPVRNHDASSVAYVPNVGFVAGHDSQSVVMLSQDGNIWGAAASDRVVGEIPMITLGPNVWAVDTKITTYEKIVRGDASIYGSFEGTLFGVTGLTDAVNCWAASGKEILLLEKGGRVTYIPLGSTEDPPAAGTPVAPQILSVTPSGTRLTIAYTNPGSSVTSFVIQYSTDYGSTWTTASSFGALSTDTVKVLTQLTNGTTYVLRVAAVNSAGRGAWSEVSVPATPNITVPSVPYNVIATPTGPLVGTPPSNSHFTLQWSPPTSGGGAATTSYLVEMVIGNAVYPLGETGSSATSVQVGYYGPVKATLRIGFTYSFRVTAINSAGRSAASEASTPVKLS